MSQKIDIKPTTSPTENEIISNSLLEHLYNHEFEDGRFFQVVFQDENEVEIKLAPRTMMKITYIKEKDDIEGIEIIKLVAGKEIQKVKFNKFNFQQLRTFLDFINSIDLKGISSGRISLSDDSLDVSDEDTQKKIITLLSRESGGDLIADLLSKGIVTNQDLVNTGYRKQQLKIFKKLLSENYLETYKSEINMSQSQPEKVWQYFFKKNQWIFGYGLDYRFQGILQDEFHASDSTASGSGTVISDYLLGDKRFTTFVEIKLPQTPLFKKNPNRSNSWKLSSDLIEAYSQILEQKASGMLKIEGTNKLYDSADNEIKQSSYDSKTVLLVGTWSQIQEDSERTLNIKEKTFELFRRDSRNIDILTYDELYERANFIATNKKH